MSHVGDKDFGHRYHGDQAALPGMLDFAVNVRGDAPPQWLRDELAGGLTDLGRYPGGLVERRAVEAAADRHGRSAGEVLLLAGGAEGFALLPNLAPRRVALIAPSFTEPAAVFAAWGIDYRHVVLPPPFRLADGRVPDDADLVVIGNPTNPTSVLHRREEILALRRRGRILVVDEAFADAIPGEPESLAGERLDDVVVLRSLTKTWALAGLRVGYALGAPEVLARLSARRPHWPVGTLPMIAVAACCAPARVAEAPAEYTVAAAVAPLGGRGRQDGHRGPAPVAAPARRADRRPGAMGGRAADRGRAGAGRQGGAGTGADAWQDQHHHHRPRRHVDAQCQGLGGEHHLHQPFDEAGLDRLLERRHHPGVVRRHPRLERHHVDLHPDLGQLLLDELRRARWLLREPGSGTREAVEQALLPHLRGFARTLQLGNTEAIKQAAIAGLGLACLSRHALEEPLALGRLRVLQTPLPTLQRMLWLVRHPGKQWLPGLQALLGVQG